MISGICELLQNVGGQIFRFNFSLIQFLLNVSFSVLTFDEFLFSSLLYFMGKEQ